MGVAGALGLLLAFGFAQPASAQVTTACTTTSLCLDSNYFVTGDYVVGGAVLNGPMVNGLATGTIAIPDPNQPNSPGVPASVPAGADIVAAFLYWETVESTLPGAITGQVASFNNFTITGQIQGNPKAPTSWSSGGCSGSSQGGKTMHLYRADVRPFLPLDATGRAQGNSGISGFPVGFADSGTNGHAVPFTLGATLVIVYRVQSPLVPLNAVVIYSGAVAPSNTLSPLSQPIVGFYQAAAPNPVAKITHIVGNGQTNKSEVVKLNGVILPSLYGNNPPFPGIYNGSWDNPTWVVNNYGAAVTANDSTETTSVTPTSTGAGCPNWGAIVFSTTVADDDLDGLPGVWKDLQGYVDANTGQWVALPGAQRGEKDLFVELDWLSNLDGSAGPYLHSHLPKKAAIDKVGDALKNQNPSVSVHFDLGPGIYQGDPYVITYPVPPPPAGVIASVFSGAGGNPISEGLLRCDPKTSPTLCVFPGVPTIGWKEGLSVVKNTEPNPNSNPPVPLLGNFQPGRSLSYHYVLAGHALGFSRTYWSAAGEAPSLTGSGLATLVSIVVSGNVGTVTLTTPPPLLKPGDCPNPAIPACSDPSFDRVTVEGALQPQNKFLNGTYHFLNATSSPLNKNTNMYTTTFTIQMPGVADGTYEFFNPQMPSASEPQLGLAYAGPTSGSGYSDIGGADSIAMTFGLWPATDPPNCQPDPSVPQSPQTYCVNQVGTIQSEAGVLLHELGHSNFLTHGGTLFPNETGSLAGQYQNSPQVEPSYGLNCNPAFLSSMNYLFVIRGFPEVLPDGSHPIGYSGQTLGDLDETKLNETNGIGTDIFTGATAAHFTRWFAPPNQLDQQLQAATGQRFATVHCDGTPKGMNEPPAVRVDGSTSTEPSGVSGPIDWNNDLIVPDPTEPVASQDVNFNGSTDHPFPGFNDLLNLDLRQIGARASSFAFSGGGGSGGLGAGGSGGLGAGGSGGLGVGGSGGLGAGGSGGLGAGGSGGLGAGGSGGLGAGGSGGLGAGGGPEQDVETACSTADPPAGLSAVQSGHNVVLTWSPPGDCQVQTYHIWRAQGTFTTPPSVIKNSSLFKHIGDVSGTPPSPTFTDTKVQNKTTYTYFVTDGNTHGAESGASGTATIPVSF
jgi:hypothetical protein